NIEAKTGLFIGGTEAGIAIGGVDKVVVRNALTKQPYIPGSSLKGKMRSLLERATRLDIKKLSKGKEEDPRMNKIYIHSCENGTDYDKCHLCPLFGVPSKWEDEETAPYPTRLIVRDAYLTKESEKAVKESTELLYTEAKTEVSIDRLTSAANPRTFERVPAGAVFSFEFVVNLYTTEDKKYLDTLRDGMALLQGDYLGGQGSRGYGQIEFGPCNARVQWFGKNTVPFPLWMKPKDGSQTEFTFDVAYSDAPTENAHVA
ncbi:MAG: type III-A CRISPR-associated RAMP protein Csm3, partial [Desulfatibacillaceae bacterium]|nr:type III-A CRISPR-associated RAMP protein Csm3 [Desulfatibacillaceae bacterium]